MRLVVKKLNNNKKKILVTIGIVALVAFIADRWLKPVKEVPEEEE